MKRSNIANMIGGWFIGNFEPNIAKAEAFEACVKNYLPGESEPRHYQITATEITVIISGEAKMNAEILKTGDIILIEPGEAYDFQAITKTSLVAIKYPSLPNDKVLS